VAPTVGEDKTEACSFFYDLIPVSIDQEDSGDGNPVIGKKP
jgi:hypothetical protein